MQQPLAKTLEILLDVVTSPDQLRSGLYIKISNTNGSKFHYEEEIERAFSNEGVNGQITFVGSDYIVITDPYKNRYYVPTPNDIVETFTPDEIENYKIQADKFNAFLADKEETIKAEEKEERNPVEMKGSLKVREMGIRSVYQPESLYKERNEQREKANIKALEEITNPIKEKICPEGQSRQVTEAKLSEMIDNINKAANEKTKVIDVQFDQLKAIVNVYDFFPKFVAEKAYDGLVKITNTYYIAEVIKFFKSDALDNPEALFSLAYIANRTDITETTKTDIIQFIESKRGDLASYAKTARDLIYRPEVEGMKEG